MTRRKRVLISPELILQALAEGSELKAANVVKGIPPGSQVVGSGMTDNGNVFLLLSNPDFPSLQEGDVIPELPVVVATHDPVSRVEEPVRREPEPSLVAAWRSAPEPSPSPVRKEPR